MKPKIFDLALKDHHGMTQWLFNLKEKFYHIWIASKSDWHMFGAS